MTIAKDDLKFLSLGEAAQILRVSKRTLLRMIQQGKIPASKVGGQWRIREGQLLKWVERNEHLTYSEAETDDPQG